MILEFVLNKEHDPLIMQNFSSAKEAIAAVLKVESTWPLAAMAYQELKNGNPEYLTNEEEIKIELLHDYVKEINSITFNGAPISSINSAMAQISYRVLFSFAYERETGQPQGPGGFMTLFGHASLGLMSMGYVAILASEIDGGAAERTFKSHIASSDAIIKSMNQRDIETSKKLMPIRALTYFQLQEQYEELLLALK
jgi:hypothetical protein